MKGKLLRRGKVKHELSVTSRYSGTCGDHYCPGHYRYRVTCVCGEVVAKDLTHYPDDLERRLLQHRLDVVERRRK